MGRYNETQSQIMSSVKNEYRSAGVVCKKFNIVELGKYCCLIVCFNAYFLLSSLQSENNLFDDVIKGMKRYTCIIYYC